MITAEQCRVHAKNHETIWRGKPGWDEQHNMAIEWRKAADEIERLTAMLIRAEQWISTQPDHEAMCAAIREVVEPKK